MVYEDALTTAIYKGSKNFQRTVCTLFYYYYYYYQYKLKIFFFFKLLWSLHFLALFSFCCL